MLPTDTYYKIGGHTIVEEEKKKGGGICLNGTIR